MPGEKRKFTKIYAFFNTLARVCKQVYFRRQGTINDELPSRILTGTVVVKPAIKEFTENGIIWADGSRTEPVDNIILATGYRVKFDMIEQGKLIPTEGNFARLYKYIYPFGDMFLKHNTLGIIGLIQASFTRRNNGL